MKLVLQINDKAIQDPSRKLAEHGILVTPPLDESFWVVRVPVSKDQAIVGFPKFTTIGIGFQHEKEDWNTNLPYTSPTLEIYEHIKVNKGRGPKREDCIKAIEAIQKFVQCMKDVPAKKPDAICRCDNCSFQDVHSKLPPAKELHARLELGGVYTDVECPKCGALCYPVKDS